ncbi:MAG: pirin family protein [Flavobacteriales bacterium]|nr:pirin family protein [Flavobacteriales bacterium]
MSSPSLLRLAPAHDEPVGGLLTQRAFPTEALTNLNPFLFLNHHGPQTYPPGNTGLPFGPHPHKGFETLTFIEEGPLAHRDSTGGSHVSGPGGVQWMTAGSGIVHAEVSPPAFLRDGGPTHMLQLWMNLPASLKGAAPSYQSLAPEELTTLSGEGWDWQIISGEMEHDGRKATGPARSLTGLFTSRLHLHAGANFTLLAPPGRTLLLYVAKGKVTCGEAVLQPFVTPVFDHTGGTLILEGAEDATLLICHGEPIDEPVVSYGPFVMNTEEEIRTAFHEFRSGKYGHVE